MSQVLDVGHAEVCLVDSQRSVAAVVAEMKEEAEHLTLKQKEVCR